MVVTDRKKLIPVIEQEIANLEHELAEAQAKLEVLRKLRDEYLASLQAPDSGAPPRAGSRQQAILETVTEFLRERPEPTPIAEILDHLRAQNIAFGGANPRNALSVLLSRSDRFQAHGRRGWTLVDDTNDAKSDS